MESEPEVLFDIAAEMDAMVRSQNIARRLGANLLGQRVNDWMMKNLHTLTVEQVKELSAIITE